MTEEVDVETTPRLAPHHTTKRLNIERLGSVQIIDRDRKVK
jgi:hypothetical protein